MIKSFRHNGLQRFYLTGSMEGIQPAHARKIRFLLVALETARTIDDMDIPSFNLHSLKATRKGQWAISVSGNWRITFEFQNGNVYLLNYEDYH